MRKASQEIWEISKIWWVVVPGGALGVVTIVQEVEGVRHETVWFWGFCAMTALWLATLWRLRGVLRERDVAEGLLADENTREAVARRIDRFREEYEQLGSEAPGELKGQVQYRLRSRYGGDVLLNISASGSAASYVRTPLAL
jgi:hypothetical protein